MVDTFGIQKLWLYALAAFGSPTINDNFWKNTTVAENSSKWLDAGDIFQDTATLSEEEQSKETYRSETSARRITIYGKPGSPELVLELMSPDLDLMARYFGGTVTTANGKKTWERPANFKAKPFAMQIVAENGLNLRCAQVAVAPRVEMEYSETGILRVPLNITLIDQIIYTEEDITPTYVAS